MVVIEEKAQDISRAFFCFSFLGLACNFLFGHHL